MSHRILSQCHLSQDKIINDEKNEVRNTQQELSYRKQIPHQLRTRYVKGISSKPCDL